SIWSLQNIWRLIENRKGAFGAGQVTLQTGCFLAYSSQWFVELAKIRHQQDQIAQKQDTCLDVPHAQPKSSRRPHRSDEADNQTEAPFGQPQANPGFQYVRRAAHVAILFVVFPSESLDDAHR